MPSIPTLHLIAGVNGAGKTTFYRYHLEKATPGAEFVNADEIAREKWPGREGEQAVEAALLADARRNELLEAGLSFVAETVFSHESKLDLVARAKKHGFRVILYHVSVSSEELARARIATRVKQGGHDVPDDKVRKRYDRSLEHIPKAALYADLTFVYDNSGASGTSTHTHVMTLEQGRIVRLKEKVPDWVAHAYQDAISTYRRKNP